MLFKKLISIFWLSLLVGLLSGLFSVLFSVLFSALCFADLLPMLDTSGKTISVNKVMLLRDETQQLTADEVWQLRESTELVPVPQLDMVVTDGNVNYWFFIEARYVEPQKNGIPLDRILTTEGFGATRYKVFEIIDKTAQEIKSKASWKHLLTFYPNQKQNFLIKLTMVGIERQIRCKLWSPIDFAENVNFNNHLYGVFFGVALAMLIFNFAIFFFVRDIIYLYYSLYIASLFIGLIAMSGYGFHYLWTENFTLDRMLLSSLNTIILFCVLFNRLYFQIASYSEKMDKLHIAIIPLALVTLVMNCSPLIVYLMYVTALLSLIMVVVVTWGAVFCWLKGSRPAGIYLVSFAGLSIGAILFTLNMMNVLDNDIWIDLILPLAASIQLLTLSLALADKIKCERQEKEDSQKELLTLQLLAFQEQSERERVIKKSQQKYQSLYENNLDGLFNCDSQGYIQQANSTFRQMFGFDESRQFSAQGLNLFDNLLRVAKNREELFKHFLAKTNRYNDEVLVTAENGKHGWGSLSIQWVTDAEYGTYAEGSIRNITERKEKEQIKIETEAVQAATQAKGNFLANMSHEIRTPLTAIIGFSQALFDKSMSLEARRRCMHTIVRSGHHLLTVINDILDLSVIESNTLQIEPRKTDLLALIHEITSYFELQVIEKDLAFNVLCEFPLPQTIITDATRLKQILINLCGNAVKFTERGKIKLTIAVNPTTETLHFAIADTGLGIAQDMQERVFHAFEQAAEVATKGIQGTGLGLHIAKELAKKMGGDITLQSQLGSGSTFTLTVATGSLIDVAFVNSFEVINEVGQIDIANQVPSLRGRILLVDDNEDNRNLVVLLVAKTGLEIDIAKNGKEGLKKALAVVYDLILMDIQMPEMDGIEATSIIIASGSRVPIVAFTSNVMKEDIAQYQRAGFSGYIAKPIDRREFYLFLTQQLTR